MLGFHFHSAGRDNPQRRLPGRILATQPQSVHWCGQRSAPVIAGRAWFACRPARHRCRLPAAGSALPPAGRRPGASDVRRQSTPQIGRQRPACSARGDAIAEHLSTRLHQPVRQVMGSSLLNLAGHFQKLGRLDLGNPAAPPMNGKAFISNRRRTSSACFVTQVCSCLAYHSRVTASNEFSDATLRCSWRPCAQPRGQVIPL